MNSAGGLRRTITHEFVEFIPDKLEEGVLYVSMIYATAAHRCLCGCGREVVTPLSPTDWQLAFDGESVSLAPSVGNWSFPCRSHYWIERNHVDWCGDMPQRLIDQGRIRDRQLKAAHFAGRINPAEQEPPTPGRSTSRIEGHKRRWWLRLGDWLQR